MKHPDVWPGILLALAAFRITRLVGWDDLTIPIRRRITGMSDAEHHHWASWVNQMQERGLDPFDPQTEAGARVPPVSPRRFYVSKLIHCPWCAGWWISVCVWLAWLAWPAFVVWACVPFAVSAIVGLVSKQLDP